MPATSITVSLAPALLLLLSVAPSLQAQGGRADALATREAPGPNRVGLALSGGTARGLAHIGVLHVLEEAGVPVHTVAGTSMGAVIGGLYAIGYSAAEIDSLVHTVEWERLLDDPPMQPRLAPGEHHPRAPFFFTLRLQNGELGLPSALIAGREIGLALSRLLWPAGGETEFRRLPIPFAAVATELETGRPVVLRAGSLRRAVRASMSMPTVFEPASWNGRLLIDGGLVRNLPAAEARELGSNVVICSDFSLPLQPQEELAGMADVLTQAIAYQSVASVEEQLPLCDVLIRPLEEVEWGSFAFDRTAEWIRLGEQAARAALPRLREIAATAAPAPSREPPFRPDTPVLVSRLEVDADDPGTAFRVRRIIAQRLPVRMTAADAARAAAEVLDAYRFSRVGYRLDATATDTALIIEVDGRPAADLGFLFRFDDWSGAALLFAANFSDRLRFGSETHLDARLGRQLLLRARHLQEGIVRVPYDFAAEVRYLRVPLHRFEGGRRTAERRHASIGGSAYAGWRIERGTGIGLQLKAERNSLQSVIAGGEGAETRAFYSLSLLGRRSTIERGILARGGGALLVRSEHARRSLGGGADFSHHLLAATRALPLGQAGALRARMVLGSSHGPDLPADRRFYLGGVETGMVMREVQIPFPSLAPHERSGSAVQLLGLSAYHPLQEALVVGAHVAAAGTPAGWRWAAPSEYVVGAGATAALTTRLGDIRVDVAGNELRDWPRVSLHLGSTF